jgi:hypothetical protein
VSDLLYTTKPRRYLGPVHVDLFPKCIIDQTSNLSYLSSSPTQPPADDTVAYPTRIR